MVNPAMTQTVTQTMTPAELLRAALAAGEAARALLRDPAADTGQVADLADQRAEWLAAAQAALAAAPPQDRPTVAPELRTLADQQLELARQLAERQEQALSGLARINAAAGRVRRQQAEGATQASGRHLDRRS